ncbi:hypothetical protein CA13_10650 [Planctomycetes bacterium CA13]|uniref:MotA/TolQ/ExbB proton channel domain-containing protein n=1 Tax=Novipirellula herctigrandis TaxID=2527986 RepID=A0A5C5YX75_9BACT|nr:hypothetical protein CA13_10650 [Planctomycetes bacterium CA13]
MDPEPIRQSLLSWIFAALGLPYVILLPLAGLLCFLLALIVVLRGRGPMAAASLILVVHVPFFIGLFAAIQGAIASYSIIATSVTTPKPSEVAAGISTALVAPLVGMLLMVPGYATAAIGAFIRSLGSSVEETKSKN